jgi:serine/threonine-protein kinase
MHGDSQLTRDGAIIGSPLYMSPEQGRGGSVDLRSDIYSLGCALYHMLCGRPPFTGPSPVGVISMHVTDKAPPVRVVNPNVPEVLARIVERMMA